MRWPLMFKRTHEDILWKLCQEHMASEESHWRQFAHNSMWERKCKRLEDEIAKLKQGDQ